MVAAKWHLAKSLATLLAQVNAAFPRRSKASDGTKGDSAHASRKSDHNPVGGIVHALDITHDPKGGFDSYAFGDAILKAQDPRLSYVISNGRIGSGPAGMSPGQWRKYTGANPHDHHVHVSVTQTMAEVDLEWDVAGFIAAPVDAKAHEVYHTPPATLKKGSKNTDLIKTLQSLLTQKGFTCKVDGVFGAVTMKQLKAFQTSLSLHADGICGPQSWKYLTA